jgi:hypothetical protein
MLRATRNSAGRSASYTSANSPEEIADGYPQVSEGPLRSCRAGAPIAMAGAYGRAQTLVAVLKACGDKLTRENVMK